MILNVLEVDLLVVSEKCIFLVVSLNIFLGMHWHLRIQRGLRGRAMNNSKC